MFRKLLLVLAGAGIGTVLGLMAADPASAQDAQGDWLGTLDVPGRTLRIAVHIRRTPQGALEGSLDSLDQNAAGIRLAGVAAAGGRLSFTVPAIAGGYEGTWDAARSRWAGTWKQGAASLPLEFARDGGTPAVRPVIAGLDGDWDGALETGAGRLRCVLHVRTTPAGTTASFDSLDQSATGIPVTAVARDGARVRFRIDAVGGSFEGVLNAEGDGIEGRWTQSGATLPLTLKRRAAGAPGPALRRPQDPVKPYPYREKQVSFENPAARVRLAGTLTLPQGAGPFPAVVLIAGSGPLDRDETIMGHRPFLVLADHLTRRGIAVLRTDKRGVGRSSGDHAKATTADFASDAEAGVAFLQARKDIDPRRIGLVGHSEGGLIAPMIAARSDAVAFAVLLAGPGVPGDELLLAQSRLLARAAGLGEAEVAKVVAANRRVYAAVTAEADRADVGAEIRGILKGLGLPESAAASQARTVSSDWFRFFLTYDPGPALRRLRCPVLAVNGSKDLQVPARQNLPAIRAALADNADAEVLELPGLNHLFQTAATGAPREYGEIEETISPAALEAISGWVLKRVEAPSHKRPFFADAD